MLPIYKRVPDPQGGHLTGGPGPPGWPLHGGRVQGVLFGPHPQLHHPGQPALVVQLSRGGYHQGSACW